MVSTLRNIRCACTFRTLAIVELLGGSARQQSLLNLELYAAPTLTITAECDGGTRLCVICDHAGLTTLLVPPMGTGPDRRRDPTNTTAFNLPNITCINGTSTGASPMATIVKHGRHILTDVIAAAHAAGVRMG